MQHFLFTLLILLNFSGLCLAQKETANVLGKLSVNGINFTADRQAILKAFGKPVKQFKPHYECGFLSSDEQGEIFYTLDYRLMKWTGNKKSGYIMEDLLITPEMKYIVHYKDKKLSSETTQDEFMRLTGVTDFRKNTGKENPEDLIKAKGNPKLQTTSIDLQENSDDKYIFYFLKGKLCKIEYWSPC